jgi:hypothetical protein
VSSMGIFLCEIILILAFFYVWKSHELAKGMLASLRRDYESCKVELVEAEPLCETYMESVFLEKAQKRLARLQYEYRTLRSILYTKEGVWEVYRTAYTSGIWKQFKLNFTKEKN